MPGRRDASPFIKILREYFQGRKSINPLRFRNDIAPRTQPPPNLPQGPHAKLGDNYYYSRDARRLVKQCDVLVKGSTVLKLPEGGSKPTTALERVPGRVFHWDH